MRCFLAILSLALFFGCSRGQGGKKSPAPDLPDLRLVVVTDLEGYLEPCGCTSNPLGGIDRLAAQVRMLREEKAPVVVLVAGDTFFNAREVPAARVDQAKRNAKTLARILNRLEVVALLPGSQDRAQPSDTLEALRKQSSFPWLAMNADIEALKTKVGRLELAVIGVRRGAAPQDLAAIAQTAHEGSDLTIVLVDGSRRDANRAGAIEGVDFVIQGGLDEGAPLPPHQAGQAWVLHAGRQGQGLTVVDIYQPRKDQPFVDRSEWSRRARAEQLERRIEELSSRIAAWERAGDVDPADLQAQRARLRDLQNQRHELDVPVAATNENRFAARWIELTKKAPRDEEVARLMREHDKAVNQANRIAFANLKPPPLGPDDVAYVGSEACAACHAQAYAWWRNHAHGVAYLTLQQRSKEYNLDCVGCHVTGYERPGGSTVTHNLDGALVNVGCESCHGPGAAHVKDPEVPLVRDTPESTCVTCHNQEHSDLFDYEAYRKTIIVPGHGLPPVER
ncbi:MAG: multiheme c-type cytochrome [Polyangiales bacterium]